MSGQSIRTVHVIGAGVAGLTAAHELAERGFTVRVYEVAEDTRRPGRPAIGGMARTQWSRVAVEQVTGGSPTDLESMLPGLDPPTFQDISTDLARLPASQASPWPEVYFGRWTTRRSQPVLDENGRWTGIPSPKDRLPGIAGKIADYLRALAKKVRGHEALKQWSWSVEHNEPIERIYLEATVSEDEAWADVLAEYRAYRVMERLTELLAGLLGTDPAWRVDIVRRDSQEIPTIYYVDGSGPDAKALRIARLHPTVARNVHTGDRIRWKWQQRYVRIALRSRVLPGEHGYRLFPAFYRHLRDTMRRTPIYTERPRTPQELAELYRIPPQQRLALDDQIAEPSSRSTHDNLIPVTEHTFAPARGRDPRSLPRFRSESIADLFDTLDMLQRDQGWSSRDLLLAQLKFLQYATSSSARRKDYESISWWHFMKLDLPEGKNPFSECFRHSMERWPQALIGLRASEIDARTFGSTALQQFLDQLRPFGYRDGTLNGPTTTAWLDHWERHLEHMGVKFVCDELVRLEIQEADGDLRLVPVLASGEKLDGAYVVLALPVEQAWKIARDLETQVASASEAARTEWKRSDFLALRTILDESDTCKYEETWLSDPKLKGPLQHFAGIQFFLEEDYQFARGHTYYPDSPWGLTSIAQTIFRHDKAESRYKYGGIISVVIGTWDEPGTEKLPDGRPPQTAWNSSDDELARECWNQIVAGYHRKPSMPRWYHVDRNIRGTNGARRNDSPYLTTPPDRFARWPGRVGAYRMQFGNVVLAGTYMQTSTRLVTMESANESGRHAVKAILDHWAAASGGGKFVGVGPEIWSVENYELRDLDYFKRLDARLHAEGLPHAFEILRLEEILTAGGASGAAPATLLDAVARVASSQGRTLMAYMDALRGVLGAVKERYT